MRLRSLVVPAATWSAAGVSAAPGSPPTPAASLASRVEASVERARQAFEIPGVSVVVVKDGRVLLAKGYGLKRLGGTQPVDEGTLFAIASNTKAFTAAALGLLTEDGALAWDDPVTRRLPAFQMYDPYVSREMTIRDLLTHRSRLGLGEGDIVLEGDHLVLRFSHSPALTGDLEHWQYDTFVAHWRNRTVPDAFVSFALRPDGSVDQFKMAAVSPAADFSYDYQDLLFRPVAER